VKKITSNTTSQTYGLAADLVKEIQGLENQRAVVVALVGDLGSGKTTFVQGFAKALGVKENITSPTFVIQKKFEIRRKPWFSPKSPPAPRLRRAGETNSKSKISKFKILIHIDAYRIDNTQEILDLGWGEMINDSKNIIIVEWADKIKKILPKDSIWIKFKHLIPTKRQIRVQPQPQPQP